MLPLGQELQRRGHQVSVFGIADMKKRVAASGLQFISLGEKTFPLGSSEASLETLARLDGLKAVSYTVEQLKVWAQVMLKEAPQAFNHNKIDAHLANQGSVESGSIADACRIPFITISSAVPLNQEPAIPPVFSSWDYRDDAWGRLRNSSAYALQRFLARGLIDLVVQFRRDQGLSPYQNSNEVFSPILQISQFTQDYELPRKQLPPWFHFTGPFHSSQSRESIPFPWERLTGRPLIYASMGTLQNRIEKVYDVIADACSELEADLVLSLGQNRWQLEKSWPKNAILVPYAPQLELLKRAQVMIGHAGTNSTMECLMNAVPMVVIPISNDQPGNSVRIKRCGVGEVMPLSRLSVPQLREKIRKVLSEPDYKKQAQKIQNSIKKAGGVARAADLIEEALRTGKPVLRNKEVTR